MVVSPFDGVNRIRFKGSPSIADFRFAIADLKSFVLKPAFGYRQWAMSGLSARSVAKPGLPRKLAELSNSSSDSKSVSERVQRCGSHVTIGPHNKFKSGYFGGR